MTIDEFARVVNTSTRNVRAYLERGLLPPPRMIGRAGLYDARHVERMTTIHRLQQEGFSLGGIRSLLDVWNAGGSLEDLIGVERTLGAARGAAVDASALFPITKFQRPTPRPEHVQRLRCLNRLDAAESRHVLITAPAGSGKSILAAQMLARRHRTTAWISLEHDEEEAGRFWTSVLIGIRAALPDFGGDALAAITGGGQIDQVLVDMTDELAARQDSVTLVLDDLHQVGNATVARQLEWFLEHAQDTVGMIICSRTRPDFAVARMVMSGQLVHLDAGELSFSAAETGELLINRLGVTLSPGDVREITARTDGWAAGIYVAGLSLRAGTRLEALIDSLGESDRQTQEYFLEEVLSSLEPRHLAFLEEISILDRFTPDLCDAVRQRSDSLEMLEHLQQTNLFIIPLDVIGRWRRLHHMLAATLRSHAAVRGVDAVRARHARAAAWHEAQDNAPEAIDHYINAAAYDDAGRILGAVYPHLMNISHQGDAVSRRLALLPEHVVNGSASLCLASAAVAGLRGERIEINRWLSRVESFPEGLVLADGGTVRSNADFMRACFHFGELEQGLLAARVAYRACPPTAGWAPMVTAALALLCLWAEGPTDEILQLADEVIADPGAAHQPIALTGAWALKAAVLAEHDDRPAAIAAGRRAAQIRAESQIDRVPQAANTWSSTARAHLLLGDINAAATDSATGLRILGDLPPDRDATGAALPALIVLAHARRLQGRDAEARTHIAQARMRMRELDGPGRLPTMLSDATGNLSFKHNDGHLPTPSRR